MDKDLNILAHLREVCEAIREVDALPDGEIKMAGLILLSGQLSALSYWLERNKIKN